MTQPKSATELAREHFKKACPWMAKEQPDWPLEKSITMQAYLAGHQSRQPELDEALEVIRFYAEDRHRHESDYDVIVTRKHNSEIVEYVGGKLARQFLTKHQDANGELK